MATRAARAALNKAGLGLLLAPGQRVRKKLVMCLMVGSTTVPLWPPRKGCTLVRLQAMGTAALVGVAPTSTKGTTGRWVLGRTGGWSAGMGAPHAIAHRPDTTAPMARCIPSTMSARPLGTKTLRTATASFPPMVTPPHFLLVVESPGVIQLGLILMA